MTTPEQRSTGLYRSGRTDAAVREGFSSGQWPVAVYGLEAGGVRLARAFAEACGSVIGVASDTELVDEINRGESRGAPASTPRSLTDTGALTATTDAARAADRATVHVIRKPATLAGRRPDLTGLLSVARSVGEGIDPGDVVLVNSLVPPHTCRGEVRPTIASTADLPPDHFGLAYCADDSGRWVADRGDVRSPRVVGGVDEESTRLAWLLYGAASSTEVVRVDDTTTAECVAIFGAIAGDVNRALSRELESIAAELGADGRTAIRLANTRPECDLTLPSRDLAGGRGSTATWFLIDGWAHTARLLRAARIVNERAEPFAE